MTEDQAQKKLEEIDLIQRRHRIYSGLVDKEIELKAAMPPGRTDCESYIAIPVEDDDAALVHQHEWQHIFFKSDLRARAAFVEEYLKRLENTRPGIFGKPLAHRNGQVLRPEVEDFLYAFINGLDDLRVCSLWEDPYPQSAEDIQNRWRRILIMSKKYANDITMYMMALGLGLKHEGGQLGSSIWRRYQKVLLDGVEKVRKKAFPACLIAARWILDSILDDVLELHKQGADAYKLGPPEPAKNLKTGAPAPSMSSGFGSPIINRPQGDSYPVAADDATVQTEKTLSKLVTGNRLNSDSDMMDTDDKPVGPDPNFQHTKTIVNAAMGVSTDAQVQLLLQQSQVEIEKVISALKGQFKRLTPDQKLLKGVEKAIKFFDVDPTMVDELKLTPEDERSVAVLHQHFSRLKGRRRIANSEYGSVLDAGAYIDLLMGSGDQDIFEEETTTRGFSSLVLIDMSGSMKRQWDCVSRACKVLAKSMKFPFSKLEVWGFTSGRSDKACIFRFEDVEKGYMGAKLQSLAWGLTPLHLASEVAIRRLSALPGTSKHLFILTDGIPVYFHSKSGHMANAEDLILEMALFIREGRKKHVHTSGLVIGSAVDDLIADVMFGHRRFWSRTDDDGDEIFTSLVSMVKTAFIGYLNGS